MLDEAGKARADAASRELWQGDLLATPVALMLETPASTITEGAEGLETVDEEGRAAVYTQDRDFDDLPGVDAVRV